MRLIFNYFSDKNDFRHFLGMIEQLHFSDDISSLCSLDHKNAYVY